MATHTLRSRREVEENQEDRITRVLAEVTAIREANTQLAEALEELRSQPKRSLFKQEVDTDCSDAVRRVYQELSRQTIDDQENRIQFNFTQKFSSEYNQSVSGKIVSEVRSVHGKSKWKRSMIKAAVASHYKSRRDDETRKRNNKYTDHRAQVKQQSRKKRKLENRKKAMKNTPLSIKDRAKVEEIFSSHCALDYISSEEDDLEANHEGPGPKPRKVIRLGWQRSKLRNLKAVLDESHMSNATPKQKRLMGTVRVSDEVSPRPAPQDSPRWAVRQEVAAAAQDDSA